MQRDSASTSIPQAPRRRRRVDWGRHVARALCVLFALIGALPMALFLVVQSAWAKGWAVNETTRILREQGIVAHYRIALKVWPLALDLENVVIDSTDDGGPAVECRRVRVRPKVFALLSGKLAIDQVELDEPHIRVVVEDGQFKNLAIKLPESKDQEKKPFHAPFSTFAVTGAEIDATVDNARLRAHEVDVDVTAEDDARLGSSFELALRLSRADFHMSRLYGDAAEPKLAVDDDSICALDGRVRYEPGAVIVRRLEAQGSADLDVRDGPAPACDLAHDDKRRVELSISHLHVVLPEPHKLPQVDGHLRGRGPIGLAERAVSLPETDGWIGVDLDVRYADDTLIPDLSGHLEAHDIRLAQFNFAHEVESDILVRRNIVTSSKTRVWIADGIAELSDTVVEPLAKQNQLKKTRLDVSNVSFTSLMRDLGVHPKSHVGWDVRELHSPMISGSFFPLKLDGEVSLRSYNFGIYDRWAGDPTRARIFGFEHADVSMHLAVRPDGVKFQAVHAKVGAGSDLSGGFVSLGFHNDLRVELERADILIDDVSPIGPVKMSGRLVAKATVGGKFNTPTPEGEVIRGEAIKVADVSFGDLTGGKFAVDVHKPNIELTNVRAKKGQSEYEVTTARLDFGGGKGFRVDALASTPSLYLADLLSMFNLDADPRWEGLKARMSTQGARVHVALGGEEDKCGGGFIDLRAKTHLTEVGLFGEAFESGDADVDLTWRDREQGIAGADVNVASFVLNKAAGAQASAGTVLGSASIRRGGALSANVVVDNVPLSRITMLGDFAPSVDGQVSAVAEVHGNLDEFDHDPGFAVNADVDVSPVRVRGVPLPQSHARVQMTQVGPRQSKVGARLSGCGAPIGPPFDKDKYLRDTSSHGEVIVDGDLFGGQLALKNVRMTREKAPHLKGAAQLRGLDLGALYAIASPPKRGDDTSAAAVRGEMWGDLLVRDLPFADVANAQAELRISPTVLRSGKETLRVAPTAHPILVQGDALSLPAEGLELTLDTPSGFSGRLRVVGGADHLSKGRGAGLRFTASLDTIKLAEIAQYVPKVERALGTVQGEATLRGTAASPEIAGRVQVAAEEIVVHGMTGAMTDVKLAVDADARQIRAEGSANFSGGSLRLRGYAPVSGAQIGFVDGSLQATGLRFSPDDGVSATANAELRITMDPHASGGPSAQLPHVSGDVLLTSFEYTRPINLTTDLSGRARRTNVQSYDPSQDSITFDVNVRTQSPLKIKNNLADIQLVFDSGTLLVSGTNQRVGLRGDLRSLAGGRFHFRASDFDIKQGLIRFEDPTRIAPNIDVIAVTEYRRYLDSSAGSSSAASYASSGGAGIARSGASWRITLHAYGDTDNVRVELTSDPPLSQEDIVLLLSVGMTRAEIDQLQASSLGASIALNYLGAATGADRAVKEAIPVIDDFRFGSATTRSGKTDPQLTIGKRLTENIRASVTTGFSEDRELRSIISWRLNQRLSVEGSYDNVNDVAQSSIGNVGVDLRWRLEFE